MGISGESGCNPHFNCCMQSNQNHAERESYDETRVFFGNAKDGRPVCLCRHETYIFFVNAEVVDQHFSLINARVVKPVFSLANARVARHVFTRQCTGVFLMHMQILNKTRVDFFELLIETSHESVGINQIDLCFLSVYNDLKKEVVNVIDQLKIEVFCKTAQN